MEIRFATLADTEAILEIYAQYIDTDITFEYTLPTVAEFQERIRDIRAEYPYLVAVSAGQICGYAYAHRLRERTAYQWDAELSVYVDRTKRANGVGHRLYAVLLELLKRQRVHTVYGCVTLPNAGSEALHQTLGFQTAGIFHKTGYKNGQWHDVIWYEKQILDVDGPPEAFIPMEEIREGMHEELTEICKRL